MWAQRGLKFAVAWVLVGVGACHMQQRTDTRDLGEGAALSLTLQPFPLVMGKKAELYATLRKQRSAGTGCQVQYRQFPLESGAADVAWLDVPEQSRSGIYKTHSLEFVSTGVWRIEFNLTCGEEWKKNGVGFEYTVTKQ
ncbi:MAG: hypothetical protein OEW08_00660 [Gammaproteobacteria bacterium]|nr:hypothetical protein [Gammaproteobacteria bacterium]